MAFLLSVVRRWLFRDAVRQHTPYGLGVPAVVHSRLNRDEFGDRRVFVVGDVHGCHDELLSLLEQADALVPDVQVIFVGDLVNKGPKNVECVELARRIGAFAVRGNHDEVVLSAVAKSREQGGAVPQRMAWLSELGPENERWLLELPYTIHIPWLNALFVHAGLVPDVPLAQQKLDNMIHMRNLVWDEVSASFTGTSSTASGEAWATVWKGPLHVYFGHDARRRLQTERHATGLDTGCVYGGSITGMYLNGDQEGKMYSVKAKEMYRVP